MTKNSAEKRAAREYQAAHPGMTYPEALREVKRLKQIEDAERREGLADWTDDALTIDEILRAALAGDDQLVGVELSVDHLGGSFDVDLGPEIEEGPIDVESVDVDIDTLWFDEHERFDGDTTIGEAHVTAAITYTACVFKSTFYAAPDTVSWHLVDSDWNDHYVRVEGEFTGELVYHFVINEGSDRTEGLTLEELIQIDGGATTGHTVAS